LKRGQIADVIAYLRYLGNGSDIPLLRAGAGYAPRGAEIFRGSCASCHGHDGEGASGPQLNNATFLRTASDGFLSATMVLGRGETPMRSMVHGLQGLAQIDPAEIPDVVAFLRLWDGDNVPRQPRLQVEMTSSAISNGEDMFSRYCAGCHGANGRGVLDGPDHYAPALNNPEFLAAASDGFLLATIARGRRGTPMRPFGEGAGGIVSLDSQHISDIVSYLRSWQ
jgi:cytochrome c oxidase cbb3-type subunit 3